MISKSYMESEIYMEKDCLKILNVKRAEKLRLMRDNELWEFLQENERAVKKLFKRKYYPKTGALFGFTHGKDRYRQFFFEELEDFRENIIYLLTIDLCISKSRVVLGYWGKSGFLDNADSCDVKTSDEFMPPFEEDDEMFVSPKYFHLLEIAHVEKIINLMQANSDTLKINTPIDISRIKKMKNFCLKHEGFKIIYIYDI